MWAPVLIASLGCYAEKLAGYLLPERVLNRREVHHVAALLPNVIEFPILWLALARLGAVLVPVNRLRGLLQTLPSSLSQMSVRI